MAQVTIASYQIPNYYETGTLHELRVFSSASWVANDQTMVPGRGVDDHYYQTYTLSVASHIATIPAVVLYSQEDALNDVGRTASYTAQIFIDGVPKDVFMPNALGQFQVPKSPTSTIWGAIETFNSFRRIVPNPGYPDLNQVNNLINIALGTLNDASSTIKGRTKLSVDPASPTNPIAVGDNDPRLANILYANAFAGADVGAKVNAADAQLGSNPGTIYHFGGGNIATQIILNSNHTLHFGAGTYTSNYAGTPILMKSDTTLEGDGWQTIIQETTASGNPDQVFQIVSNYAAYLSNGSTQRNMTIRDIQFLGARSDYNSAPQTLAMGNVHGALIDNVYLNSTHTIGIVLGGASTIGNDPLGLGRYSENCTVKNSLFYRVASQNISVVNGKNIQIINNFIKDPSQTGGPGVTAIDCEINQPATDRMENILISGNIADTRNSDLAPHGNFIAYQPGNTLSGPAIICDNILRASFKTSNGIIMSSNSLDVTINDNYFQGCGQHGLQLSGTRINASNNVLVDSGTGGISTINIACQQGRVYGNTHMAPILGNGTIDESIGANNNHVFNNNMQGNAPAILLVGAASKAWANIVGTAFVNDNISVGASGTIINKILRGTVTVNPASINANTVSSQTFTLSGALTGDSITLNPPLGGLTAGLLALQYFISASDTLTIVFFNTTGAPIDQASGSWTYQLTR